MLENEQKDYLTGFYHREALKPFLRELLLDSKAKKRIFSMVLIDMDRFKRLNDRYGHSFGDLILKYLAGTLRMSLKQEKCYLFRYGGDEFIAVLPDLDPDGTYNLLKYTTNNLSSRPFLFENKCYKITVSCGIASFPQDGQEMWELFERADQALYFSKHQGTGRITHAGKMGFMRFRKNILSVVFLCTTLLAILILYGGYIRPKLGTIREIVDEKIEEAKIASLPENLDILILKDGSILEGRIMKEADGEIVFSIYLGEDSGSGSLILKRSEIHGIRYRKNPTPEKVELTE